MGSHKKGVIINVKSVTNCMVLTEQCRMKLRRYISLYICVFRHIILHSNYCPPVTYVQHTAFFNRLRMNTVFSREFYNSPVVWERQHFTRVCQRLLVCCNPQPHRHNTTILNTSKTLGPGLCTENDMHIGWFIYFFFHKTFVPLFIDYRWGDVLVY